MKLPLHTLLLMCWLSPMLCTAQVIGGDNTYEFLNLPSSARITALGGHLISVQDDDVNLAYHNPAVLNASMHQQISFNHSFLAGGVHHGYVAYGHHQESWKTSLHASLQYVSYGTFDATDEFGTINGEFKASEYAFNIGGSYQLYDRVTLGTNVRLITSQLESFNSLGLAADFGLLYRDSSGRFSAGLVIRNAGGQLTTYTPEQEREPLPFDIQIGISQRLKHLPFRFSVTYHNLQRWNIRYDDPNTEETTFIIGDGDQGESDFQVNVDNFFRHFVFSGEFLFGKLENFRLRFAYNHLRNQELSVDNFRSLTGFSMGLGFKIKRFRIDYGRSFYHLAGGANHLAISTNIQQFKK
ncbi:MAG: type IX secretion system protein PorQ [Bacteroidota bacterium]